MSTSIEFKYVGPTFTNCDPSEAQQQALASDMSWQNTLTSSYSTIFGQGSAMYKTLSGGLDSIIAKGANAMGYSDEELAAKNAQAINSAAASAKAVNAAIGRSAAKSGAVPGVESGIVQAERAGANTAIMSNLSNKEADITEKGYEVGREEFNTAIKDKEASLAASFSPAAAFAAPAQTAITATNKQNLENQASKDAWKGLLTSSLGGIANAATGGISGDIGTAMSKIGSGNWGW